VRITAVETLSLPQGATVHAGPIQWLWVRIHTDSGLIGLRETYPFPAAEAAVIHRVLADRLLGQDPSRIEFLWNSMFDAVAYAGWAGAGIRAISAVDIALWDIKGKALRVPVFDLLGGATRDRIRTYNTCYDRISFLDEPVRLAESLYDSGIRAMKIWPFDGIAKETGGNWITEPLIDRGIEPLVRIRERFGSSMEVALEFHGYWNVPGAIRIAQACEPLRPMWLEEMLPQDNMSAY
jgi:L-alanine-DL-glutamate epimerase-like enolase superfamily enzyme